jgi:hypothetical protein
MESGIKRYASKIIIDFLNKKQNNYGSPGPVKLKVLSAGSGNKAVKEFGPMRFLILPVQDSNMESEIKRYASKIVIYFLNEERKN